MKIRSIFLIVHFLFFNTCYAPRHAIKKALQSQFLRSKLHEQLIAAIDKTSKKYWKNDLDYGFKHFEKTPGFLETMERLHKQAPKEENMRGYFYELEAAVNINKTHSKKNEPPVILGFNQIKKAPCGNSEREFDLIAQVIGPEGYQDWWIECKSGLWKNNRVNNEKQFTKQDKIVMETNQRLKTNIQYIVRSKNQLTKFARLWFAERKITVQEEEAIA